MLTGCFPFWRRGDEELEVQAVLQKLLPRISKADYQKPKVSGFESRKTWLLAMHLCSSLQHLMVTVCCATISAITATF